MWAIKPESPYPGNNHHRKPESYQYQVCGKKGVACNDAPNKPDEIVLLVDDPSKGNQLLPVLVYSNRCRRHSLISFAFPGEMIAKSLHQHKQPLKDPMPYKTVC